jgi:hypothetical protein
VALVHELRANPFQCDLAAADKVSESTLAALPAFDYGVEASR